MINVLLDCFIIYRLFNLKFTINYNISVNNKTFCYFHQKDRRWNKLKYGKSTIGNSGCGVVVLSMIHSAFNKEANPISTAKWITDNFHINIGTPMDIMAKYLEFIGVDSGFLSRDENIENLINNNVICVLVRNRFYYLDKLLGFSGNHSIVLYEISENKAYIADPDDFSNSRKAMNLKSLKKRVELLPKNITHPYIYVRF
jgi:ABC-type bacteriocin/lantibiotic exporter with double-glycine peptidase domain